MSNQVKDNFLSTSLAILLAIAAAIGIPIVAAVVIINQTT
jgi:hypothetical protein